MIETMIFLVFARLTDLNVHEINNFSANRLMIAREINLSLDVVAGELQGHTIIAVSNILNGLNMLCKPLATLDSSI